MNCNVITRVKLAELSQDLGHSVWIKPGTHWFFVQALSHKADLVVAVLG